MDFDSPRGTGRRRLLGLGGLAAAGVVAGGPLLGAGRAEATSRVPPDTLPGGAYDRYLAQLAAEDKFSGVVLLTHHGRTVLSRSYGMADKEKGIRNDQGVAFNLSSAGKPFRAVAILQLAQQGRLKLSDTVGTYLTGYATDIAEQVTIHHLLSGTSGLSNPPVDLQRTFTSRAEVHEYYEQWARQATLVDPVGTPTHHAGPEVAIPAQIVEAVTGQTYWDYVEEHIFRRCGMTGTAYYTRPQWLTDAHIAHAYMTTADGSRVDAVRNLDVGSPSPQEPGKNPGRNFIDALGDGGFATAPDLVRFAHALRDGTVLDRHHVELFTGPKMPHASSSYLSFGAYGLPIKLVNDQWVVGRGGADPGCGANWNIYPESGWVGVFLSNYDSLPMQEIGRREMLAVTGGA